MATRAKIVTITSRKGGVGKTAITSLLARYFVEVEGKNVLVVDFDARGGITSLLCDRAITQKDLSIGELLLSAYEQGNIPDAFAQSVIDTGLEKNKHWEDNGGKLYLLPAKKTLDAILASKHSSLLRMLLLGLDLSEEYKDKMNIYRIDTGSEPELAAAFGIRSIPSLLFVPKDGKPQMAVGALPREAIEEAIKDVMKVE